VWLSPASCWGLRTPCPGEAQQLDPQTPAPVQPCALDELYYLGMKEIDENHSM